MNQEAVTRYFDDQILTAQKARKMYQEGADERTGIQRDSYLAYADAQATRETYLRETYSALLMIAEAETRAEPHVSAEEQKGYFASSVLELIVEMEHEAHEHEEPLAQSLIYARRRLSAYARRLRVAAGSPAEPSTT